MFLFCVCVCVRACIDLCVSLCIQTASMGVVFWVLLGKSEGHNSVKYR